MDTPDDMTVEQAAGKLDVSEPTVLYWVRRGLLETATNEPPMLTTESVQRVADELEGIRGADLDEHQWESLIRAALNRREQRLADEQLLEDSAQFPGGGLTDPWQDAEDRRRQRQQEPPGRADDLIDRDGLENDEAREHGGGPENPTE